MSKKILCLSRSYLSKLYPILASRDTEREYYHIVQNLSEQRRVEKLGGTVVLNIETLVKSAISNHTDNTAWQEPEDFREVTGFAWSPLYTDRYLLNLPENLRLRVAEAVHQGIEKLFNDYDFDFFLSEPVALFTTHILFYFCMKNGTQPRLWVNCYFPNYFFFASTLDYSRPHPRPSFDEDTTELDALIEQFCTNVIEDKAGPAYHFSFSKDRVKNLNYFKQRVGDASLVLRPGLKTKFLQMIRLSRAFILRCTFPYKGDFQSAASLKEHWFYFKCLITPRSYYDSLPTPNDNIVVFPLQYEPEASLLYAAPDFYNQLAFVETILRALPDGKTLYIKEHPNQFGALGLKPWRLLRKKYHNIRYIYGRESGRELIRMSSLVITVSSTAGMDGILLGKPVIVAGRVFYDDYPNVTRISGYHELPKLLRAPPPPAPAEIAAQEVMKKFKELALNSYSGDPQPSPALYTEENIRKLVAAIAAACT